MSNTVSVPGRATDTMVSPDYNLRIPVTSVPELTKPKHSTVSGTENLFSQSQQAYPPLNLRYTTPVSTAASTRTLSNPPHKKPALTTIKQASQLNPAQDTSYDKFTQTEPGQVSTDKPDQTAPTQSRTDGQPAPAQSLSTENPVLSTSASDLHQTEKNSVKIVEFHKPNWKERLVASAKIFGSYLIAPLKLAAKAVEFIVWQPLKKFIITPIYVGCLYLFNREKYDSRKMGQEMQASKAARILEQANDRARTRAYQLLAKQAIDVEAHKAEMEKYKPGQRANKLFHSKLAKGELKLKKKIGVDTVTGKSKFTKHAVVRSSDQVLDTETADAARRLGNDPALRKAMNEYNEAVDAHEKAMAEHHKAVKRARQKGESLPAEPVLTAVPPVFRCTDKYVIAAYKNASEKLLDNLWAKEVALDKALNEMRAEFKTLHPEHIINTFHIENDSEKAEREGMLKVFHKDLQDHQAHLAKCEAEGDQHPMVPGINAAIEELNRKIDMCERNLAIYSIKRELFAVREERFRLIRIIPNYLKHRAEDASDCQARDRLNTNDWKAPVMKDKDGNILEVFTRNENGNIIALNSDKFRQATHIERSFKQMITPEHNGSEMPTPVPYQDQQGLTWSRVDPKKHPYQSYLAVKGEDGLILKDRAGNVIDWEVAPGQLNNHWEVKPTLINGEHEGYNKCAVSVKKNHPFDGMSSTERQYKHPAFLTGKNLAPHNSVDRAEVRQRHTRSDPSRVIGPPPSQAEYGDTSYAHSHIPIHRFPTYGTFQSPEHREDCMASASGYVDQELYNQGTKGSNQVYTAESHVVTPDDTGVNVASLASKLSDLFQSKTPIERSQGQQLQGVKKSGSWQKTGTTESGGSHWEPATPSPSSKPLPNNQGE